MIQLFCIAKQVRSPSNRKIARGRQWVTGMVTAVIPDQVRPHLDAKGPQADSVQTRPDWQQVFFHSLTGLSPSLLLSHSSFSIEQTAQTQNFRTISLRNAPDKFAASKCGSLFLKWIFFMLCLELFTHRHRS